MRTMAIDTRPAVEADRAFVVDCFLRAMRPSLTAWRGGWNEPRERIRFEEALDLASTTIIGADDEPVGFVMVTVLGVGLIHRSHEVES